MFRILLFVSLIYSVVFAEVDASLEIVKKANSTLYIICVINI